jgi:hypothetical protein
MSSKFSNLTRRELVASMALAAGGVATLGGCASATATAESKLKERRELDLSNPEEAVKAYAKIVGSLSRQRLFLQYYGEIYSIVPGEVQRPLFQLKGLVRADWRPNDDGSYYYENYDHGLFCDFESGEVLSSYKNPFTGEINTPLHYKSGPAASTLGLGEGQENPVKKDWRITGDQIFVSDSRLNSFTNPVSPEKWGKASTGEKVHYSYLSTYLANTDDVADPTIDTVNSDHTWTFVTNYPAWMMVGDMPGNVMWRWIGKKFSDPAEIDPYIAQEVEKRAPKFFTNEKPWPLRSDGWTQYTRERKPK